MNFEFKFFEGSPLNLEILSLLGEVKGNSFEWFLKRWDLCICKGFNFPMSFKISVQMFLEDFKVGLGRSLLVLSRGEKG